jgi:sugar-specific transcriptional regulator TrmB
MNKTFNYQLLGLETRDIRVYEALLEHEQIASVRSIATWTGLNRGVVFLSIGNLIEQGLISSFMHGKQKRYFANDPSGFKSLMEYKFDELDHEKIKINNYISELKQKNKTIVPTQFAEMYEGEEEVAVLLRDVLAVASKLSNKTYYVISAAEVRGHLYKKFNTFTRQRIKQGVSVRVLSSGLSGLAAPLSKRKNLPLGEVKPPACYIIIYGNKVAQISLHDNFVPYGIVTNNHELAVAQQLLFDQVWKSIK